MLDIALPRIKNTKTQGNYASYDIEPLDVGYGMTLGNALRRVLLSSLPGATVTSLRIKGIQHESLDVPGVLEGVTDIVLNVKRLRLRNFSDHPVSMCLEASGKRYRSEHPRDHQSELHIARRIMRMLTWAWNWSWRAGEGMSLPTRKMSETASCLTSLPHHLQCISRRAIAPLSFLQF